MILGFIPAELLKVLGMIGLSMLVGNLLGMYKAVQWFRFDKGKAMEGFQQSFLIIASMLVLIFGISFLLPAQADLIPAIVTMAEGLASVMVLRNFKQLYDIFNARKQIEEQELRTLEQVLNDFDDDEVLNVELPSVEEEEEAN